MYFSEKKEIPHHNPYNDISDRGAKTIAQLIRKNSGFLENIDLSHNNISIKGIISINTAIQSIVFERFVNLSNNPGIIDGFIDCNENVEIYNNPGFSNSSPAIYEYYLSVGVKTIGEIDKSDIVLLER